MGDFFELLFSFDGSVGRTVWWVARGIRLTALVAAFAVEKSFDEPVKPGIIMIPVWIIGLWPMIAIEIKRWHDRGKSGAWILINLIPFVGPIWSFIELGFIGRSRDRY
jgi:uncharacterized membrane protein YhaH (DUF805 family)